MEYLGNNGLVIGLTGQTGAGKTNVSNLLLHRGFRVIDADYVARQVVAKGTKCLLDLAIEFGIEILEAEGTLNRRKLGEIVFRDKNSRARLNQITFPYIQEEILVQIREYISKGDQIVFLDAPTLFESGTDKYCDKIVSVIAPFEDRLRRVTHRDQISNEDALARMNAQHDDEYYASRSDFVINNNGDLSDLRVLVVEMLGYFGINAGDDGSE